MGSHGAIGSHLCAMGRCAWLRSVVAHRVLQRRSLVGALQFPNPLGAGPEGYLLLVEVVAHKFGELLPQRKNLRAQGGDGIILAALEGIEVVLFQD